MSGIVINKSVLLSKIWMMNNIIKDVLIIVFFIISSIKYPRCVLFPSSFQTERVTRGRRS